MLLKSGCNRKKVPVVLHMDTQESGAAVLSMMLGYFGRFISLEDLRMSFKAPGESGNADTLLKVAPFYDLTTTIEQCTLETLLTSHAQKPCIITLFSNYYVVLTHVSRTSVRIIDPCHGKMRLSRSELKEKFSGQVIRLTPTADFKPGGTRPSIFFSILRRLRGARLGLMYVVFIGILLVVPGIAMPVMTRIFFDQVLGDNLTHWLAPLLAGIFLLAVVKGVLTWIREYYLTRIEALTQIDSSVEMINHMLRLPVTFFQQQSPGELLSRFNLIAPVMQILTGKLGLNLINLVTVIFFIGLMFQFDVILTVICLVSIAINIIALRLANHVQNRLSQNSINCKNHFTGSLTSGLQMIESIKAVDMELEYYSLLAGRHVGMINASMQTSVVSACMYAVPPLFNTLTSGSILIYGAYRILEGDMSIGMLIAFQLLACALMEPITALVNMGGRLQESQAGLTQLDDILASKQDERFNATAQKISADLTQPKLCGMLEFKNVTFGYSKFSPPLLENFSLKLEPGQRVAVVGRSGSGKSTVARLATGLYAPWSGEILYDGKPREAHPVELMNNSLVIVNQNIYLFRASVLDNLSMWDVTIPENVVMDAAVDAHIHDEIVSKSHGYSCLLEENGSNFSGGQRQRLEIARALALNPTMIVLDEATSALDPQTEQIIDDNLRRRGCSCLIIAHRLSTIRDSDEIIVMDNGKIVERGKHDELVARQGTYYNLVNTK